MSLSAHNVKVQIMYKIDKWIRVTRKVKSPTSLLQGPQESSLTVEGSIRKAQFVHHQISQWNKKTPTMPWRTQRTDHVI